MKRKNAALTVTVVCSAIATLCSLSLGDWDFLSVGGKSLLDCFDFLTGQIMLPMGGFLTCLFLGWYMPRDIIREQYTNWGTMRGRFLGVYLFFVRFVCPISILAVFLHQFGII